VYFESLLDNEKNYHSPLIAKVRREAACKDLTVLTIFHLYCRDNSKAFI
jgi:hypothetical protein